MEHQLRGSRVVPVNMKSIAKKPEMSSLRLPSPDPEPPSCSSLSAAAAAPADGRAELPPRILLIAREGQVRAVYEAALRQAGVEVEAVDSIEDFRGAVQHQAFNGIVIDIATKIKALSDHKDLVSGILSRFPVIQVNLAKDTQRIRALLYGRHERYGELTDLIRETCLTHPPRQFRTHARQPVHLNVLLATSRPFQNGQAIQTVTNDLCEAGCFIITSGRFQVGQTVWIRILELYDKAPIACMIHHKRKWGEAPVIPGIGVSFQSIRPSQVEDLRQWL